MSNIIDNHISEFENALEFLKRDISGLRTGRATPALLEDIQVEAYGTKQPLKALASILIADAKTLTVEPWDKTVMQDVEKAIRDSQLGMSPVNEGHLIRIRLPELSEERRQELIKVLHQKLENARISVRKVREDVRSTIEKALKDKDISEDEKYKLQETLDEKVKEYNSQIKEIGEKKEEEIKTV